MAVKDAVITLTGSNAKVERVMIMARDDGQFVVTVIGHTLDGSGNKVQLVFENTFTPGSLPQIDNLLAAALTKLRQTNGLE